MIALTALIFISSILLGSITLLFGWTLLSFLFYLPAIVGMIGTMLYGLYEILGLFFKKDLS